MDGVVKRVLLTAFPVRVFVVAVAAGFGAALVTGFAAAFGATLVDAAFTGGAFTGAAFTGVLVVTLLTCFAFVTCSPPLPLSALPTPRSVGRAPFAFVLDLALPP